MTFRIFLPSKPHKNSIASCFVIPLSLTISPSSLFSQMLQELQRSWLWEPSTMPPTKRSHHNLAILIKFSSIHKRTKNEKYKIIKQKEKCKFCYANTQSVSSLHSSFHPHIPFAIKRLFKDAYHPDLHASIFSAGCGCLVFLNLYLLH